MAKFSEYFSGLFLPAVTGLLLLENIIIFVLALVAGHIMIRAFGKFKPEF